MAGAAPRVWFLHSDKGGDNAQVQPAVDALPWPVTDRFVRMRDEWVFAKPRVRATLDHIDLARSDPLEPPWPDLVITIGRRPSMAALWVRQQSGGQTKIALFGKPSGPARNFDLIVYSSEAQLPPMANSLRIRLPLMRVDKAAVELEAARWRERLASLPRPLIAFLIGGPTGPYRFDDSVADGLIAEAHKIVGESGGTPFVITSRRTPKALTEALVKGLPRGGKIHPWAADMADNPYKGVLGLADGFVVTADSISMMVEVASLGRPMAIHALPSGRIGALDLMRRRLARYLYAPAAADGGDGLRLGLARVANASGLLSQTRDFKALHDLLVGSGMAVWAGEPLGRSGGAMPDDLPVVVRRIEALMAGASTSV